MSSELICIYCNTQGKASVQHLVNVQNREAKTNKYHYLQGWCTQQYKIKTLRSDGVIKVYETAEEAGLALSDIDLLLSTHREAYEPQYHISQPHTFDICFTGFKKADKETLTQLAKKNNMNIHVSVVKHLDMLCCGLNTGPVKLKKAVKMGVFIINREQFEHFVSTGEIPDDIQQ